MPMPNMLAYTIKGSFNPNTVPYIIVGQGANKNLIKPTAPIDSSYWWAILDATNPHNLVKDFSVSSNNNTTVPAGLDAYMSSPNYIFAMATQFLAMNQIPQGDLYDYLVKYGAGRALGRIEQLGSALGCGSISRPNYILTGQCGPRGPQIPSPPSYEMGSVDTTQILTMSLMPLPNGNPPYSICDSLTFNTR
jgi:hypothetical protein